MLSLSQFTASSFDPILDILLNLLPKDAIAIDEATSPFRCPPMPSQTTIKCSLLAFFKMVTESSLCVLTLPVSVK